MLPGLSSSPTDRQRVWAHNELKRDTDDTLCTDPFIPRSVNTNTLPLSFSLFTHTLCCYHAFCLSEEARWSNFCCTKIKMQTFILSMKPRLGSFTLMCFFIVLVGFSFSKLRVWIGNNVWIIKTLWDKHLMYIWMRNTEYWWYFLQKFELRCGHYCYLIDCAGIVNHNTSIFFLLS